MAWEAKYRLVLEDAEDMYLHASVNQCSRPNCCGSVLWDGRTPRLNTGISLWPVAPWGKRTAVREARLMVTSPCPPLGGTVQRAMNPLHLSRDGTPPWNRPPAATPYGMTDIAPIGF
jgi:hypothetical protein